MAPLVVLGSPRSPYHSDLSHRFPSVLICLVQICVAAFGLATPGTGRAETPVKNRPLIVLIGGMDSDPTPDQIAGRAGRGGNSGLYRLMGDLRDTAADLEYFNWNGTRAGQIQSQRRLETAEIVRTIRTHANDYPSGRLILVGNSWGGHTTWEVCRQLFESPEPIAIDYVLFLDPSSTGRSKGSRPEHLPINVDRATNLFTRNLFSWRQWPAEPRIENIDLGDPSAGFLRQGGPAYDSMFDFTAHVAAEWDEAIHRAMRQRIVSILQRDQLTTSDLTIRRD